MEQITDYNLAHRVDGLMLRESDRRDAVDGDGQDGDQQVDEGDPVAEERPEEENKMSHRAG